MSATRRARIETKRKARIISIMFFPESRLRRNFLIEPIKFKAQMHLRFYVLMTNLDCFNPALNSRKQPLYPGTTQELHFRD
jgi:hypothetical protein